MSDKILSIIILCYNKFNFTRSCLKDLSHLSNDHEIIVVDNGSTDETNKCLENSTEIKYLKLNENIGFARGCNYGYLNSTSDNVLFLNNDIRVNADYYNTWTKPLIDNCVDNILCGPTMGMLDDNLNFVTEANRVLPGKSYLSGWCIAGNKNTWNKLNLSKTNEPEIFSKQYGLAYFEDTDLSFRAKKIGIQLKLIDVPVVHFGKQTSSQLNTYQLYKNARAIFVNKWQNVKV